MLKKIQEKLEVVLTSADMAQRRPELRKNNESNISGLYIIGDLAGAPVIKYAMAQGFEVIEHIGAKPDAKSSDPATYDLVIIGGGAAGLNAALAAKDKGLRAVVLEKGNVANTIENFPEGKWVYAEPDTTPPRGKLWLDGARKEDLLARWHQIVTENQLDVRTEEGLKSLQKQPDGSFIATSEKGNEYRARRAVLATGQRGNPRKLKVPGEERENVYHRLYSPRHYKNEDILVVGGGNSAIEAALVLSDQNRVRLSYRGSEFGRIFKDNERKLNEAVAEKRIELIFNSSVREFGDGKARIEIDRGGHQETIEVPYQHAFVLVGADIPVQFLKSLGIRLENEWTGNFFRAAALTLAVMTGLWFFGGHASAGSHALNFVPTWAGGLIAAASFAALISLGMKRDRYAWLGVAFLASYTVYGAKVGDGTEFWPFRGWGYKALSLFDRPWSFWYTVLYTVIMTVFGLQALKRWGLDRKDRFQIWRYVSLLSFQWALFLIPEFLFQWAIKYQWVGEKLATDPTFAEQSWRAYGIVYAWPLFFYTFFFDPHIIWVIWGIFLTFILIPILVIWHGKRYCSWVCGCGGLAETFGDRWRHLAPKGRASLKWEWMNHAVLWFAVAVTAVILMKDAVALFRGPGDWGGEVYHFAVDVWLVGILPVTLYPFLGGKVWCRYWCPLAKLMHLYSKGFTKLGWSRFEIRANDKCIGCTECSRNCQVGIDVMSFALKQDSITNANSSCIGCGICVSVCPMDTLSFGPGAGREDLVQIHEQPPAQRAAA